MIDGRDEGQAAAEKDAYVFVSYRRADTQAISGRIYDRLTGKFGQGAVYMDVDNIPLGVDFRSEVLKSIQRCGVLLAVIGPQWLSAGSTGFLFWRTRRLDDPADHLRIEIEAAFKTGTPVIPVLVEGAEMPKARHLPKSLGDLVYLNAASVDSATFDRDVPKLLSAIELGMSTPRDKPIGSIHLGTRDGDGPSKGMFVGIAVIALLALLVAVFSVLNPPDRSAQPDAPDTPSGTVPSNTPTAPPPPPALIVEVDEPLAHALVGSRSVPVKGRVEGGVGPWMITVDGEAVTVKEGAFDTTIELKNDGEHYISVLCRARDGEEKTSQVPVIVDTTPPAVRVTEPQAKRTTVTTRTTRVAGTASDRSTFTLNADGNPIAVNADNTFETEVDVPETGSATVVFTAVDELGNKADPVVVELVYQAPVDSWEAPLADALNAARSGNWSAVCDALADAEKNGVPDASVPEDVRAGAETYTAMVRNTPWAEVSGGQIEAAAAADLPVAFENALGMRFALVAPGSVSVPIGHTLDGSPSRERYRPQVTRPFLMQTAELTNAQFRTWRRDHDSGSYFGHALDGDDQPVVSVSLVDATSFAKWLSGMDGVWNYRVPTESEWLLAAAPPADARFWWGNRERDARERANAGDLALHTKVFGWPLAVFPDDDGAIVSWPVGTGKPNRNGLADMAGNVWEWCTDWFAPLAAGSPADSSGPDAPAERARVVVRGGSWTDDPRTLEIASRMALERTHVGDNVGFRLVAERKR